MVGRNLGGCVDWKPGKKMFKMRGLGKVEVWRMPQYCKVISLQLIKVNEKIKKNFKNIKKKEDAKYKEQTLDSVGEGEGGMI